MTLTTAELAGQSIMFRFEGPAFTNDARAAFRKIRPGGVLFFGDNITSREQVNTLTSELQAEARQLGMPPLLIAIDQEGGLVSRFSADFVTVPSAMALAASGNPADTMVAATITATQLREVGINVNFAPSVDININPANPVIRTRSWGDTPEQVIASLRWVYRGHEAARIVTTVKHFPGHGDTSVDSHVGLPTIPYDRDRIDAIELAPFRAAVEMGVPAMMSAHILFPALDPDYPATLSRAILTGLLREDMGFDGLIFTDAMDMRALTDRYGIEEATVLAKLAGVDVLEANEPIADLLARHAALTEALESGRIPQDTFEATVARLEEVRQRYDITGEPAPLSERHPDRDPIELDIALRTVVHVGPKPFAPLDSATGTVFIDFQRFRTSAAEDPVGRAQVLKDAATMNLPESTVVTLSHDPTGEEIDEARARVASAETLIIMTRDASDLPKQVEIAMQVIGAAPESARVIHCCMRGPYDAGALGDRVNEYLFTFGDPKVSIDALVATLMGLPQTSSRMPVSVPDMQQLEEAARSKHVQSKETSDQKNRHS